MSEFPLDRRTLLETGSIALGGSMVPTQSAGADSTSGGDEIWSFETGGDVDSSPTVVDGTVFVGSDSLYALDAATGNIEWTYETSGQIYFSSPTVVAGTVFVGSGYPDGSVYALDTATGNVEWTYETGDDRVYSSPTVAYGTVFVGARDYSVYALDAATGDVEWTHETGFYVDSSPTVADGTVFIGSEDGRVYALDAATGDVGWTYKTGGGVQSSPTVAGGIVFVGSDSLYALDAATGDVEWTYETGTVGLSSPTVADGTVFVGSYDNGVYALDGATGDVEWTYQTGVDSSPTVADGTIFVGGNHQNDRVHALDTATGETEWTYETGGPVWSSPTVVDGTVFVGSNDNNVYALDAGVEGSSEGSRVLLRTLGHHGDAADPGDPSPPDITGTIAGTVTDSSDEPLADVTVEFVEDGASAPEQTTTTDSDGEYEGELPPDDYEVITNESGFEPESTLVTVDEGEVATADFELTADDSPLTITTVEVGPDSLLFPAEADTVFLVGVETESDAGIADVEVQYDELAFSGQRLDEVEQDLLCEYLQLLGYDFGLGPIGFNCGVPPSARVPIIEELVGLPASQIYAVDVPMSDVGPTTGDNAFGITATPDNGPSTTTQVSLPVYTRGDRFATFDTETDGSIVEFEQTFLEYDTDFTFEDPKIPDNLPVNLDIEIFSATLSQTGAGKLDLNTQEPTVSKRSTSGLNVFGVGAEAQIGSKWAGTIDEYTYELTPTNIWFALLISKSIKTFSFDISLPDDNWVPINSLGVDVDAIGGGYKLVGDMDITTAEGRVNEMPRSSVDFPIPGVRELNLYLNLDAGAGILLAEVFIGGKIHVATDIELDGIVQPPAIAPLDVQGGEVCLNGGLKLGDGPFELEVSIEALADATPGFDEPCLALGETREPPCWEAFDINEECGTYPSAENTGGKRFSITDAGPRLAAPSGTHPGDGAVTPETEAATVTRLTDRPERDAAPAVVARGDVHLAAWERHPEGEPAEYGRDIVTTVRESNGEWTDPTTVVENGGASYHEPALAAAGGDTALAWTRYDPEDVDRLDEVSPMTRIEIVLEDGDGWTDPVVIADTDGWFDRQPMIEPLEDGWLVAWERTDTDGSATHAIGYAVINATGAIERTETITGATDAALAPASETEAVVLGYHDREVNQLRRDVVTTDERTEGTSYAIDDGFSLRELAVSSDATVWTVASQTSQTGYYAVDDNIEELTFFAEQSRVRTLELTELPAGTALTYSRAPDDDVRARSLTYRLRVNGEWRPEQVPATTDADEDVKVWRSAVASTTAGDGLLTLLGGKVHDPEAVTDLFSVSQPLRPSYAITAETDSTVISPGEEAVVSYSITNTGDVDGDVLGEDPVAVEARSAGETLAETEINPLDSGQSTTGELSVEFDETGTVELVVGRQLDLLAPGERRATIEGSTPVLSVDGVSVERPDGATAIATVDIRNGGPVDAADFSVEVSAGDGEVLGTAEVAGPAAGELSSATIEYDPAALTETAGEQVEIDPEEVLPDSHIPRRVSPVLLGQPILELGSEISYEQTDTGAVAALDVTNTGPVGTELQVRAVWADATPEDGSFAEEDLLGETSVCVPAAVNGPATEAFTIMLSDVAFGDEIRFTVETTRPVTDAGVPVVYDEVGPFGVSVPPVVGDNPPQDLNGDGLYEDINGDGSVSVFDTQALFDNLDTDVVQNNPELFNFSPHSDDDEVSIFDVAGHWHEHVSNE